MLFQKCSQDSNVLMLLNEPSLKTLALHPASMRLSIACEEFSGIIDPDRVLCLDFLKLDVFIGTRCASTGPILPLIHRHDSWCR